MKLSSVWLISEFDVFFCWTQFAFWHDSAMSAEVQGVKRLSANLKPVCFITLLFCLIFLSLLSPRLKVPISCLLKAQPKSYKHAMAIFWDGPISLVTRRRHRALLSSKIWQIQSRNKIQFSSVHILIDIALIDSPLLTQSTQLIPWFRQICPRWLGWTSGWSRSALCLRESSQDVNRAFPQRYTETFLWCALLGIVLQRLCG